MAHYVKQILRSSILWAGFTTLGVFLFLMFGLRPFLHLLGLLFGLMGGQGLDGTDL